MKTDRVVAVVAVAPSAIRIVSPWVGWLTRQPSQPLLPAPSPLPRRSRVGTKWCSVKVLRTSAGAG